jgi:hypothetical protein
MLSRAWAWACCADLRRRGDTGECVLILLSDRPRVGSHAAIAGDGAERTRWMLDTCWGLFAGNCWELGTGNGGCLLDTAGGPLGYLWRCGLEIQLLGWIGCMDPSPGY